MGEALDFLTELFGGKPEQAAIQLWHKDTKKNHYFQNVEVASIHVEAQQNIDIYVAAGLGAKVLKPNKARIGADLIAAIPGVWADIDVNGGPEGKQGAAPDINAAIGLAESLLEPTVVVHSGYGIQAWWLFNDGPWCFGDANEREQAKRLSQAFQSALRAEAKKLGFTLDSTHDLARLMRVPGARNHKGGESGHLPVDVTILSRTEERYDLEDIHAVAQNFLTTANEQMQRITGEGLSIELRGTGAKPSFMVGQLMAVDLDFKTVWDRRKVGHMKDWSDSSFDLSIATRLADMGCDDQEIADALVYNRIQAGDPKGKAQRADYIKGTIGKARLRADLAEAERDSERIRSDAEEQLQQIANDGTTTEPARTVSLFTQLLGGPEVKELVQDSRDPDQARFRLVLADGREVPIGTGADLLNPEKFRSAFAVVTGHVVPGTKRDKWHKIVQALLHAATINEDADDTRAARGTSWVRDYVDRGGLSNEKDAACIAHDPFQLDGDVFIPLGPFAHWLRRIRGERMVEADIKQLLIAAGFERRTINYVKDNGKKSSRSYWVGTADMVDLAGSD
jgi:hypothetical protein